MFVLYLFHNLVQFQIHLYLFYLGLRYHEPSSRERVLTLALGLVSGLFLVLVGELKALHGLRL